MDISISKNSNSFWTQQNNYSMVLLGK